MNPREQWVDPINFGNHDAAPYIVCAGCPAVITLDGGIGRAGHTSDLRSAGWRLVIGMGWLCSECIRCLHEVEVSVQGTIETGP